MPLSEDIVDAVATSNVKVVGEVPAHVAHTIQEAGAQALTLAMQNAVANQQNTNTIQSALLAAATNKILNVDPAEAVSLSKMNTGNDVASQISALLAAVAGNQQTAKTAGNTPPVTP